MIHVICLVQSECSVNVSLLSSLLGYLGHRRYSRAASEFFRNSLEGAVVTSHIRGGGGVGRNGLNRNNSSICVLVLQGKKVEAG